MKIVIPHDFGFHKYYPPKANLPYVATGQKLCDEIQNLAPELSPVVGKDFGDTLRQLAGAEAMVSYGLTRAALEAAPKIRWIQAASAGIDHFLKTSEVSLNELIERGIVLTKAAGVTRIVIGEHAFAMILALSRNVPRAVRQQSAHQWDIFMGSEINGRTLGIIGLGEIGERVAEIGKVFGMRVLGTRRNIEGYSGHADVAYPADDVDQILVEADYLVLACSLNDTTRGLINAHALARMKPTASLINIARGEVVVENDLVAALTDGSIAAAALDTFGRPGRGALRDLECLAPDSPLWDMPNVLVMPNNASATDRIYDYLAQICVDNARRLRSGKPLRHVVNL